MFTNITRKYITKDDKDDKTINEEKLSNEEFDNLDNTNLIPSKLSKSKIMVYITKVCKIFKSNK
jgi:hypothetical protein